MASRERLLLTCEHGGNRVPARYRDLFPRALLESHRGWDPGTLPFARQMARALRAPLIATTVTRLLVDANRSLGHPRQFHEAVPAGERAPILARYYRPHRERVTAAVRRLQPVLHLGLHSFTPVLDGESRDVDVGFLYDPARGRERAVARAWAAALRRARPDLRVRMNRPYRGTSDGLTTSLRALLPAARYAGIELEVNQAFPLGDAGRWRGLRAALLDALRAAIG